MAILQEKLLLFSLLIFCMIVAASSRGAVYRPTTVPRLTDYFKPLPIDKEYSEFFGHANIHPLNRGSSANLILDKSSGSGLVSRSKYNYGFFSAAIRLPSGFTSGVVVAFYLSNADLFTRRDEAGLFKQTFMEMEASAQGEKRNSTCGLIQHSSSISTAFSGTVTI